jgi:hypothetical protein
MKVRVTGLILAVGLSAACAKDPTARDDPRPEWLTGLIADLENQPVANPPALIARYEYHGQSVYYIPPRCCDVPSDVYDASGTIICHADGGLDGAGDGRCSDFFQSRTSEEIIWRDPRGGS